MCSLKFGESWAEFLDEQFAPALIYNRSLCIMDQERKTSETGTTQSEP